MMCSARFLLVLLLAASAPAALPPYVITTVAGGNNVGDGGQASEAYFGVLEGLAIGPDGSIYLADTDDQRIRKITPDGIIHTIAGCGAAAAADSGLAAGSCLKAPYGLAVDKTGQIYIADLGNNRIRRIATDGTISSIADALKSPRNVALGPDGLLYISEFAGHRVLRQESNGTLTVVAGTGQAGGSGDGGSAVTATLRYPTSIALDDQGNLYIADSGNARVRQVKEGRIGTIAGPGAIGGASKLLLHTPTGLAVDHAGNVYIGNDGSPGVVKVTPAGAWTSLPGAARDLCLDGAGNLFIAGAQHVQVQRANGHFETLYGTRAHDFGNGGPAINARLGAPVGVAVSASGNIVISDSTLSRLREVDANGVISSSPAAVAAPHGIGFNAAGDLLIADTGFHVLQSISSTGSFDTVAGTGIAGTTGDGGLATLANLNAPTVVTQDSAGNLYFVDGSRVRHIFPDGHIETFAGTGEAGYNGDGPSANAVQLNQPGGLAISPDGVLYIADTGNHLLRKRKLDRSIVTLSVSVAQGSGPGRYQTKFDAPMGMAFDSDGNLWVADAGESTVWVLDTANVLHRVAGGSEGFSGDGGYSTGAQLSSPSAIAVTKDGRVYIADTSNRRIRLLTPNGIPAPAPIPDGVPAAVTDTPAPVASTGPLTIVNAATNLPGAPAPGSLVSIYAANLAPQPTTPAAGVALTVAGVQIFFNKIAAPLLYVSPGQINAQVPYELSGSASAIVEVRRDGMLIGSSAVGISPFNPGLFTGADNAAAVINEDGTINSANHFAPRGSIVSLFATGDGAQTDHPVTGRPAAAPLPHTQAPVTVTIGNTLADVIYAGAAPGFVGLMQVNVRVPTALAGSLAVTVTVGGVSSPPGPVLQVWP